MSFPERFYSGTSNIVIPYKQSDFPPEFAGASRLSFYASMFSSLEVNSTFYKLPKKATVAKWAASVPENFKFTFKVPKIITHSRDFKFETRELESFADTVASIGDKRGCLLVQLPPKISREKEEELSVILECLHDSAANCDLAVEFRHASWYSSDIYRLLEHYKVAIVKHDIGRPALMKNGVDGGFIYLRFHGPEDRYRGSYSDAALEEYARQICNWLGSGKTVYVYFNNTMGDALENLRTLNKLVAKFSS